MTSLTFPLPTFDLQTHRTMRVVYLKELSFLCTLLKGEKKEWLCQIHMYDKLILCVYKAFFMCIFTSTLKRLTENELSLLNSTDPN